MLSLSVTLTFCAAAILLALAPGPDNIFVLTQSAISGKRGGIFVVLGLCTGIIVHTAAVALGLSALITQSAIAFTIIKMLGAGYLIWLAIGAFRAPVQKLETGQIAIDAVSLYRRGVIMNVTNPKVAIFFLAFFPQFIDVERGSFFSQTLQLGALFALSTLVVFSAIAVMAGQLGALLRESPTLQISLNRIAGVVFVGLAAKIAFSSR